MKYKTQVTCTTCGVSEIRNDQEQAETWAELHEELMDEQYGADGGDPGDRIACVIEYEDFEVRDETAPGNV